MGSVIIPTGSAVKNNLKSLLSTKNFSLRAKDLNGVDELGDYCFYNNVYLKSLEIPSSVTGIGDYACYGCDGLTSLSIPVEVTTIGEHAFESSSNLPSLTVNYSGTLSDWLSIDGDLVAYSATKSLYIDGSLLSGSLYFDDVNITSISRNAFYGCDGLTSVSMPHIENIGDYSFYSCNNITSMSFPSLRTIGFGAFKECFNLTSFTIPSTVTSIGDHAFFSCQGLTSITIPNGVTHIGASAFANCTGLTSITIPASVVSIDDYAFYNCTGLTSLTFESNSMLAYLGEKVFAGCDKLTTLVLPTSITHIGEGILNGCSCLTSITIPFVGDCLNSEYPFGYLFGSNNYSSSYYVSSYVGNNDRNSSMNYLSYLPISLTSVTVNGGSLSRYAFYYCTYITSVLIPEVTSLYQETFQQSGIQFTHYNGAHYIGTYTGNTYYAIVGCDLDIVSCSISNDCKVIANGSFKDSTTLTSVSFNQAELITIGYEAFFNTGLTSIELRYKPNIEGKAFTCCSSLSRIDIENTPSSHTISRKTFRGDSNSEAFSYGVTNPVYIRGSIEVFNNFSDKYNSYSNVYLRTAIILEDGYITSDMFSYNLNINYFEFSNGITDIDVGSFSSQQSYNHRFEMRYNGNIGDFVSISYRGDFNSDYKYYQSNPMSAASKVYIDNVEITSDSTVVIPEGITKLSTACLAGLPASTLRLPSTLTTIESYIMYNAKVSRVEFNGTMQEWVRIVRDYNMFYEGIGYSNPYIVYCSDGVINAHAE